MAFRADEAAEANFEHAKRVMIPRGMVGQERQDLTEYLRGLTSRLGPVVDGYPTWHPIVPQANGRVPMTSPSSQNGWDGLDHTILFVNGFLTCPYDGAKGVERVVKSLRAIAPRLPPCVSLDYEVLDQPFYGNGTTPILVFCDWDVPLDGGYMIPKSRAVPLMLEIEVPVWRWAQVAETWDTMQTYLLGSPHGARSSHFVTQETGLALKKIYEAMTASGMYGDLYKG
jgi:hypothetical protein